jgi:hypothetical protein
MRRRHCQRVDPKCVTLLDSPYKGFGADSEEKRAPVSDINTALVDHLKALERHAC